ncbi:RNA-binding protein [Neobacillus mesonae]|uniref:YlmH family RNA-binding protein n=1 Tax=Neobacillus mesonae TaxID=1193713 RepID=UPI0020419CFE|nr:RNA-binding protein [Neobacillus mesonae]MCM3569139.1 RNA-binding protein [Neobacillus mesonae]
MNIYQHFRPEEREFIDQVIDWKEYVDQQYAPKLTDFLDPREQHILTSIIGDNGAVKCSLFGGIEDGERKRAFLFPEYLVPNKDDFQICLFEIHYPKKFVTIEHRQVLGTLMSLGLKRGKYGDILIKEGQIQFFAAKEVSDYIQSHVEAIGRAGVKLIEKTPDQALIPKNLLEELDVTVSSLRLDTVISNVLHVSRQKSLNYIQHGLVKVNWTAIENPSFNCREGDLISVRSYGRVKILQIEGRTKKEKWRIVVGKQK